MPYTIRHYDGSILTTIQDDAIDNTTSLGLPGPNTTGYGLTLDENLVYLLENFAGNTAPSGTNQLGQLWFNKNIQTLHVFTNQGYVPVSGIIVSGIQPATPNPGNTWFNTTTNQYSLYDGTNWNLIGPTYTKAQGISGAIPVTVNDANVGGVTHNIIQLQFGNFIFAILNADVAFVPSPAMAGFSIINPGITLNSLIQNPTFNSNIVGTLTGNVIGSLSGARVSATTLVGSLIGSVTGNVTSTSILATNLSTGNAQITSGSITGLTTLGTTTAFATNFSTSNAQIVNQGVTTSVVTNFSTGNAQITGGNLTNAITVQGTTGQFTTANIVSGNITGLTTLGATTALATNFSTSNAQIISQGVTTSVITNFSTANARITGGNITVANITTGPLTTGAISGTTASFSGTISAVSPTFTGTPTAPTATPGTNTTQIATTAFVANATSGVVGSLGTMASQNSSAVSITGGTITGTYGLRASSAATADSATSATYATSAGSATTAASATNASHATSADSATYATTAGNGGVTSVNGSTGAVSIKGLGFGGEIWRDVTGSRGAGVQYTNNTGYPIAVSATGGAGGYSVLHGYVNGVLVSEYNWQFNGAGAHGGCFLIVPPGATYQINADSGIQRWTELY